MIKNRGNNYSNLNLFFANEVLSKLVENNKNENNSNILNLKSKIYNNNNHIQKSLTLKVNKNSSTLNKSKIKTDNLKKTINYKRPKSSIFKFKTDKYNKTKNTKLIIDDDYFDISYIYNNKKNNNNINKSINNNTIKKIKNKVIKNEKNKNNEKEISIDAYSEKEINDIKKEIREKIMKIKQKKKNVPQMFIRRPIPICNEKYLLFLPKEVKKDIRNKYNFFSFLLTDDLYNKYYKFNMKNKFNKNKRSNNINKTKSQEIKRKINISNNNIFNTKYNDNKIKIKKTLYRLYKPVKLKQNTTYKTNEKNIKNIINEDIELNQGIKSIHFFSYKYK